MPTITAYLEDLNDLVGRTFSAQEWGERLALVKGELKGEDPQTRELRLELHDTNRPDLWCPEGIARQVRAKLQGSLPDYPIFRPGSPTARIDVEAACEAVRPVVGGFLARALPVTDAVLRSLIQTQEKLSENLGRARRTLSIGIYDASAIRFPVRYQAVDPRSVRFVPLGETRAMDLLEVLRAHPKGRQYAGTLDGLSRFPLLRDARGEVLSFPPIINSSSIGEVRVGDRDLFVEATGQDARLVYLGLNILAANLHDRGYAIEPVAAVFPYATALGREVVSPHPGRDRQRVALATFGRVLGGDHLPETVVRELVEYGCSARVEGREMVVEAPPWRADYLHPVDVVEDFAVSRGYDAIAPVMPLDFTVGRVAPLTRFADRVRDYVVGFGFEEVMSHVLCRRAELRDDMLLDDSPLVEIANVMTETASVVRDSLIPSLLRVEAASAGAAYPHRVFEVGEVAVVDPDEPYGSRTDLLLAYGLAHPEASFSEAHAYLETLAHLLGVEVSLRVVPHPSCIPERAAEVFVAGLGLGVIGEVHPEVLTRWGARMPVVVVELDLGALREVCPRGEGQGGPETAR